MNPRCVYVCMTPPRFSMAEAALRLSVVISRELLAGLVREPGQWSAREPV